MIFYLYYYDWILSTDAKQWLGNKFFSERLFSLGIIKDYVLTVTCMHTCRTVYYWEKRSVSVNSHKRLVCVWALRIEQELHVILEDGKSLGISNRYVIPPVCQPPSSNQFMPLILIHGHSSIIHFLKTLPLFSHTCFLLQCLLVAQ